MEARARHSILVVDDSSTIRQHARSVLSQGGYEVLEAEDGADGLAIARETPVDLIIVDINMPRMNGIQMIEGLRELPQHARTPVFVLTTEATPDMVKRGKVAGATAWIVKPFKPELLLAAIHKMLGAR